MRNMKLFLTAVKKSSNPMSNNADFNNTVFNKSISKLKTIIAIGALISLSACSSYTLHSDEPGLAVSSYPVIQF